MKHITRTFHGVTRRPKIVTDETGRTFVVPQGGDEDNDPLVDLVGRLPAEGEDEPAEPLTDEELAEAERLAVEAFDDADDDEAPDLEAMAELREVIVRIRGEQTAREESREEARQEAARIRGDVHTTDDDEEDDGEDADDAEASAESADGEEGDEPTAEDTEDAPEASAEADDGESAEDSEEAPEAVAAAAPAPSAPPARPSLRAVAARRRGTSAPRPRSGPRSNGLTVRAMGDVPGYSAGAPLQSLQDVGSAFAEKVGAVLAAGRGVPGRYGVARFQLDIPEDRRLDSGPAENEERIEAVVAAARNMGMDALVAAGGLCAPLPASYDLEGISVESRPIRDSLPRFGADRGGVQWVTPPKLSDIHTESDIDGDTDADDTAVGVWTEATDAEPGAVVKPYQVIDCGAVTDAEVDAITKRLRVGNFNRRAFPEQFARWWQLAGAAHSRVAESKLWTDMRAAGTAVTTAEVYGAARDLLTTIDTAVAGFRSHHRMGDGATLRLILPSWTKELIRVDLARQIAGDDKINVTDAEILAYFTNRNVVVTYSPDIQSFSAQSAGVLNGFPGTVEMLLFHEGAYLFLDGGTLDFGMSIRDTTLNDTNDVEAFVETFENVAYRGVESYAITATVDPTGAVAGTITPTSGS